MIHLFIEGYNDECHLILLNESQQPRKSEHIFVSLQKHNAGVRTRNKHDTSNKNKYIFSLSQDKNHLSWYSWYKYHSLYSHWVQLTSHISNTFLNLKWRRLKYKNESFKKYISNIYTSHDSGMDTHFVFKLDS